MKRSENRQTEMYQVEKTTSGSSSNIYCLLTMRMIAGTSVPLLPRLELISELKNLYQDSIKVDVDKRFVRILKQVVLENT